MAVDDAETIGSWCDEGPFAVYDLPSAQLIVDGLDLYFAVTSGKRLVAFCCVGDAARVPGMSDEPGPVDVGLSMDPDLIGHGHGEIFGRTVLSFLTTNHPDMALRAVIQEWNARSLRLTRRLGFIEDGALTLTQGGRRVSYRIVRRPKRSDG